MGDLRIGAVRRSNASLRTEEVFMRGNLRYVIGVLVLCVAGLVAWPAQAKRPLTATIVALASNPTNSISFAVDSDGVLYRFTPNNSPCVGIPPGGVTVLGNLFGGPPQSPVAASSYSNGTVFVALQNGDVWYWCEASNSGALG